MVTFPGAGGVPVATTRFVSSQSVVGGSVQPVKWGTGGGGHKGRARAVLGLRGSGTVVSGEVLKGQLLAWPLQCWMPASCPTIWVKAASSKWTWASEFFHCCSLEPQCCLGKHGLSLKAFPIFK